MNLIGLHPVVSLLVLLSIRTCSVNGQRLSFSDQAAHKKDTKHRVPEDETFAFAKHFQNHMVLQKEPVRANVYGFSSSIGETVNAELATPTKIYTYSVKVQEGTNASLGVWTIELDPQNADTPANISVTSGGTTLKLTDVIFGDVWICSGQSNMRFMVSQMLNASDETADVDYPNIRLMRIAQTESSTPLDDFVQIQQDWTRPNSTIVNGFSAVCWLYGKSIHKALGYSIGLAHASWGGTPAESWSSTEALAKCGIHQKASDEYSDQLPTENTRLLKPTDNSVLWNAMIHPFLKMTIKGVIWYQGESDASGTKMRRYNCTFTSMIRDWRQHFHNASNGQTDATFPFGFVQLAPNKNLPNQTSGFSDIRWHQTADIGYVPNPVMPNTFMAVAMDLPDFKSTYGSIHPRYKKDIGNRLSLAGLAVAYGRPEIFQGPYPSKGELTSSGFNITYGSSSTLEIRNTTGFELLCSKRWVATNITEHDTGSINLENVCHVDEKLSGVRYAWRESPCSLRMCAVYEKVNGLPGPPFTLTVKTAFDGPYLDFYD